MAFWWLTLNILSIVILAFYSMLEMACVSFNKVRLEYYVSKGVKRADLLRHLLHEPSRLFGTTLLGVNVAMFIGSECAREFHSAIGIDPNWAPLSQVLIVIVFGELAPMFAARQYPEHVALLGVPIIYASSKILAPLIWILEKVCSLAMRVIGKKESGTSIFLSQEELLNIIEEQDEEGEPEEINVIASNIFQLRGKTIEQVMIPLASTPTLPSNATVLQMSNLLRRTKAEFIPIYHKQPHNIIGIASSRDLLRASETKRVRDFARHPWFIIQKSTLFSILKQFRQNKENCAIVLNREGNAIGLVTLDIVLEKIFGKRTNGIEPVSKSASIPVVLKNRIFAGDMPVKEFNEQFQATINCESARTLSDLLLETIGHPPEVDDEVVIQNYSFRVVETTLLGIKRVSISTLVR